MPSRMINGLNYDPPRTATYVVAASDAPAHVRAQADRVCSGAADQVDIQWAIDALSAGRTWKETVKLIGKFHATASIMVKAYTILDMTQAEVDFPVGDAGVVPTAACAVYVKEVANVEVLGGIYDGSGNVGNATNDPGSAIYISGSNNVRVINPVAKNFNFCGIFMYDSYDIQIVNPTTIGCGEVIVGGNGLGGIEVAYGSHDVVIANHLSSGDKWGLWIEGKDVTPAHNVIYSGRIKDSAVGDTSAPGAVELRDCHHCIVDAVVENAYFRSLMMRTNNFNCEFNQVKLVSHNSSREAAYLLGSGVRFNDITIVSKNASIGANNTYSVVKVEDALYNNITVLATDEAANKAKFAVEEVGTPEQNIYNITATGQVTGKRYQVDYGSNALDVRNQLAYLAYPLFYKEWSNLDGFTADHTNSGAFTLGLRADLTTGATDNSRACIYEPSGLAARVGISTWNTRFSLLVLQRTTPTSKVAWFGLFETPTAPTATQIHVAFKIDGNKIYASCGDGTNGSLEDTGITTVQYTLSHLYFKMVLGGAYFYINGKMVKVLTTNLPGVWSTAKIGMYMLNSAAETSTFLLWPLTIVQGLD